MDYFPALVPPDFKVVNERPTHLDLFSGIGGFALAAQWAGFRTIGFCEIDKYCQKVLAKNFGFHPDANGSNGSSESRQQQKELATESNRICSNIFDLDGRQFSGVSLITGGFPCQPFSVAGKRRGAADDRAIWPEMFRVINEARPAWVLGENVPGIIPMELDNVLSDLEGIGYATRAFVIPACAVDARHRRDRLWVVGRLLENSGSNGESWRSTRPESPKREQSPCSVERSGCIPNSYEIHAQGCNNNSAQNGTKQGERSAGLQGCSDGRTTIWLPEPDVGRVAHGIPSRVDRLKGLGNAIVPQVAYEILRVIYSLCENTSPARSDK